MRNVFKFAEQGKKRLSNQRRDLTAGEISQIFDSYQDKVIFYGDIFDLIVSVYYFGVESGYRQAEADRKPKKK